MSNQAYYGNQPPQTQQFQHNYPPPAPNFAQHPSYAGQDPNAQYYANGQPGVFNGGQNGYNAQNGYQGGMEQGYNGQPPVNGYNFDKQAQPTIQPMMIPSYQDQQRNNPRNDRGPQGAVEAAGCCGMGCLACLCCEACACGECLDACL